MLPKGANQMILSFTSDLDLLTKHAALCKSHRQLIIDSCHLEPMKRQRTISINTGALKNACEITPLALHLFSVFELDPSKTPHYTKKEMIPLAKSILERLHAWDRRVRSRTENDF